MRVGKSNQRFSAAHRLHGHRGKCGSLHGHNYSVQAMVRGPIDANMVIDFDVLKTILKSVTDCLDHGTILQDSDPLHAAIRLDSRTLLMVFTEPPTVEAIARWIWCELSDRLRGVTGVTLQRLTIHETEDSCAEIDADDLRHGQPASPAAEQRCGGSARVSGS